MREEGDLPALLLLQCQVFCLQFQVFSFFSSSDTSYRVDRLFSVCGCGEMFKNF